MEVYKKLNLPRNPLTDLAAIPKIVDVAYVVTHDVGMLTPEISKIFQDAGLEVEFIAFFGRQGNGDLNNRMIHADIARAEPSKVWELTDASNKIKKKWRSIYCGIHWELGPSDSTFSWWDMSEYEPAYPPADFNLDRSRDYLNHLNGLHYGARLTRGVLPNAKLIDQVALDGSAMLTRTDIPHATSYHVSSALPGMTLRFRETWNSWEEALEKFKIFY